MPDDMHFKSLEERIVHMANVKASVGELEIISTASHLQQTIVIVDKDFQKISVYMPGNAASAVKRRLQAQKSRVRPCQAKQHPSKRARNGPQKKNDVDQEESWCCKICGENVQEAMTQCISCLHWVHNKCADESHILRYVCDLCK